MSEEALLRICSSIEDRLIRIEDKLEEVKESQLQETSRLDVLEKKVEQIEVSVNKLLAPDDSAEIAQGTAAALRMMAKNPKALWVIIAIMASTIFGIKVPDLVAAVTNPVAVVQPAQP